MGAVRDTLTHPSRVSDMALAAQGWSRRVSEDSLGSVGLPKWGCIVSEAETIEPQKAIWNESAPETKRGSALAGSGGNGAGGVGQALGYVVQVVGHQADGDAQRRRVGLHHERFAGCRTDALRGEREQR